MYSKLPLFIALALFSTAGFAAEKVTFRVGQAYSVDEPARAHLQSLDGKQLGVLTCTGGDANELVFQGEDEGLIANFKFASEAECSSLLDLIYQKDGLDAGKTLLIHLDIANHRFESAAY